MPQGLVTFAGLPTTHIIGGEMTMSWGVSPSSALILMLPLPTLSRFGMVGRLEFSYGTPAVTLNDCALAPSTLRIHKFRLGHRWSIKIFDRRWKWRYPTISGEWNKRDCSGEIPYPKRKKLSDLLGLLFDALGEDVHVIGAVPDVYPYVNWNNSRCDLALGHLAERFGCAVMLQADVPAVQPIGVGAELSASKDDLHAQYRYGLSVKPRKVKTVAGPTVFQEKIKLRAVGIERTGDRELIDKLSYGPPTDLPPDPAPPLLHTWDTQWPTTLTGVAPNSRDLALDTVWRWFELDPPSILAGVEIDSVDQIHLRTTSAELMTESDDHGSPSTAIDDVTYCAPAAIKGTWFPNTLYPENVTDAWFPGPFEIDPAASLVKFPYPVIKWTEAGPEEPDLDLYTSFTLTDIGGDPVTASEIGTVPSAKVATETRVDRFGYLSEVKIISPIWGSARTNESTIGAELRATRDGLIQTYKGEMACDLWLEGLRNYKLSGTIAQIMWRTYADRASTTRVSCHTEFDIHQQAYSDHRRRQRANLMANEMLFS